VDGGVHSAEHLTITKLTLTPFAQSDASLASVADIAISRNLAPTAQSGRQEWLENMINRA
jgi:xylose isomerase